MMRALVASLVGLSVVALTGCAAQDDSTLAERQELSNTAFAYSVPKASGRAVTTAFQRFCLDGAPDAADRSARLRAAGYVPNGGWRNGVREFVTNDLRPAVRISQNGRLCAIRARAQTGQDVAIRGMLRQSFPRAVQLAPQGTGEIWQIGPGEGVAISRSALGPHNNEIMLARIQLQN